ncbi:MAG: hypothetical protein OER88_10200 [Planctomycetota bacterium]|nr:hypothetical protein [Planctomycetota bacterium]
MHFGFGACAFLIRPLGVLGSASLAGAALFYNVLLAPRLGLDRSYRRPGEGLWGGLTTYPLAVLLLILLFRPHVAAGAWVVLACVDPVAAFAGSRWSRPRVPWCPRKSLVGTCAGALVATAGAYGILVFLAVPAALSGACAAAAAGALAETVPWRDDNLVIAGAAALALLGTV